MLSGADRGSKRKLGLAVSLLPVWAWAGALPLLDPFAPWPPGMGAGSQAPTVAAPLPPRQDEHHDASLTLKQGEAHVMAVPGLQRVAVANGRVLSAMAQDNKEVVVFANQLGSTSLLVWSAPDQLKRIRVDVTAPETQRVQRELQSLLQAVPQTRVKLIGDQVLLEGEGLSEADRQRVEALSKRYPQVIDFTGQMGWERMVRFDVTVMEVPRHQLRDVGVRWQSVSEGGVQAGAGWTVAQRGQAGLAAAQHASALGVPAGTGLTSPVAWLGLNAMLSARLHALVQSGSASLLATPQLTARSGSTARFMAGGEVPYATVDKNGNPNTVFKPYGIGLEITPRVDPQGRVHAVIDVEVSQVDPSVSSSAGPGIKMRRTTTEFNMQAGETLVLSGFLSKESSTETAGLPGLSALPLLGRLFQQTHAQVQETELVVLVTPGLLDARTRANAAQQQAVRQGWLEAQGQPQWLDGSLFPKGAP